MASDWRERALGDLVEIFDGPHATPAKTADGPIFLGISNLSQGRLDLTETERLSEEDYDRWTRRVEPRASDVVFSYETRLGEAAGIPPGLRCCLGRRMGLLRAREGQVDARFLLYAYLGPQFQEILRARTIHGSTVDRIPLIDMPTFPIVVPVDLDEQEAIGRVLGTLDDKIELNRRMSETLEAIARLLFEAWFINADDAQEWETGSLADFASLNPEAWSRDNRPAEIRYVDLANTKWGRIEATMVYARDDAPSRAQRVLRRGDTIIGTVRPGNGSYALIPQDGFTGSTGFAVLRPLKAAYTEFVYLAATAPASIEMLSHLADGGAYPAVRSEVVATTPVVKPPAELLERFSHLAAPLLEKVAHNERESRTLAELRNTLLPRLISGEIRVKSAQVHRVPDPDVSSTSAASQ